MENLDIEELKKTFREHNNLSAEIASKAIAIFLGELYDECPEIEQSVDIGKVLNQVQDRLNLKITKPAVTRKVNDEDRCEAMLSGKKSSQKCSRAKEPGSRYCSSHKKRLEDPRNALKSVVPADLIPHPRHPDFQIDRDTGFLFQPRDKGAVVVGIVDSSLDIFPLDRAHVPSLELNGWKYDLYFKG